MKRRFSILQIASDDFFIVDRDCLRLVGRADSSATAIQIIANEMGCEIDIPKTPKDELARMLLALAEKLDHKDEAI